LKIFSTVIVPSVSLSPYYICLILFSAFFHGMFTNANAQVGGKHAFEFLNVSASARLAGTGGVNVSMADRDLAYFFSSPALNGDTLNDVASLNYQFYPGQIAHGAVAWQHAFKGVGPVAIGIQHINYGTIQGYDDSGVATTEFSASETAVVLGKNHQAGNFRLGVSLKGIFSNLGNGFRSNALAVDMGAIFKHPRQQFTVGLAIKNLGVVLSEYSETSDSKLPLDIQAGFTYKPLHMPLRFSVTAFNLTQRNVAYHNPAVNSKPVETLQTILTHFNFGCELILHKNVNVLMGYNYFNHRALKLEQGGGGAGLSVGLSVDIRNIDFVFSRMGYVAGQAAYSFGVGYNLSKLFKRK
jgi:hypothetical protein